MRLSTSNLKVPSAPRFLAKKTSAMPPAPRRRMISKSARRLGGGRTGGSVMSASSAEAGQLERRTLRPRYVSANGCPRVTVPRRDREKHMRISLGLVVCLLVLGIGQQDALAAKRGK